MLHVLAASLPAVEMHVCAAAHKQVQTALPAPGFQVAEELPTTAVLQNKIDKCFILEAGQKVYHKGKVHASEDISF